MNITELREHIKKRLGSPLYLIEITDDQIDIQISDALDYFYNWHQQGFERGIVVLDTVSGTETYTLDSSIMNIIGILSSNSIEGMPSHRKLYYESILNGGCGNLGYQYYAITSSYLKDLDMIMGVKKDFTYNRLTSEIKFLSGIDETSKMGLYCISNISDSVESVYNNVWFQKYVSSLCKLQWGGNLAKYSKTLIGGTTVNYDLIIQEAKDEIQRLEEQLMNDLNEPPGFFLG